MLKILFDWNFCGAKIPDMKTLAGPKKADNSREVKTVFVIKPLPSLYAVELLLFEQCDKH